jgi:hypothetical protein
MRVAWAGSCSRRSENWRPGNAVRASKTTRCSGSCQRRSDCLAAGGRAVLYRILRSVSDCALRQSSIADRAAAQQSEGFLRGWCKGTGSVPFPCTPSPRSNRGKSVRNAPGLKCQTCSRPFIVAVTARLKRCPSCSGIYAKCRSLRRKAPAG